MVNASSRILIGTHTFAARHDAARRQATAAASLAALTRADIVNVQFTTAPHALPDIETLAVLQLTSNAVSGRTGPVKPVMSEILDALAFEARRRSLPYFCFTNGDIIFSQRAVDWMLDARLDAYVFSREDVDATTGAAIGMQLAGTDVVAFSAAWWPGQRHRFRAYIAGEGGWDNVYTAVTLTHSNAVIENREGLVRHEAHPPGPMPSPHFGAYTNYLAARDAWYFDRWCKYWDGLVRMRGEGATVERERAFAREIFAWPPPPRQRAIQIARNLKAVVRYGVWKARHGESA
ncbi:MAG TPA: hypothetical protein VNJ03_15120 [Vicinamibacterales bacterium]|nr:hypothetical protein [Vicinamibacterales bacterium]